MICGQDNLQEKKSLNVSRIMMNCMQDKNAGEKVFA